MTNPGDPALIAIPASREDLSLGYANTLSWRGSAAPVEALGDFAALLDWLGGVAGLADGMLAEAREWSRENESATRALIAEAIGLREAIYRTFNALAEGRPAARDDIATLNRALAEAPVRRRLVRRGGGYFWAAERIDICAAVLLAPVLWSAADLLARADHLPIRRCANEKCLWLFIDQSKAGTRRWCDMTSCGNRAKSRRHYLKAKAE